MSRAQIIAANELAWRHWTSEPNSPTSSWLERRGISSTAVTATGFAAGWAADDWSALRDLFGRHRIPESVAMAAGLIRKNDKGHSYDGFRGRIVFAIRDITSGDILGFTARRHSGDPQAPKYLNSPGNLAFRKKDCLFGAHEAFKRLTSDRPAITGLVVCEGPMDVLAVAQSPQWVAVAPCGTAMTFSQAEWIATFSLVCRLPVRLAYDGDTPGQAAAQKAHHLLEQLQLPDLQIVCLPDGRDPADLSKRALDQLLPATGHPAMDLAAAGSPLR